MDEIVEHAPRQFADPTQEAVVTGPGRQRAEVVLQFLGVAGLDKAHRHRLSTARPQDVRILLQIIQTKNGHGALQSLEKNWAGAPLQRRRRPGGTSCPPERLLSLMNDVAAGNTDIVQVAIASIGPIPGAGAYALARREWFPQPGPKTRNHDDLSSVGVNKWTFLAPKANLLPRICALLSLPTNDTLFHFR